ncbi:hypothetical protein BC830DRAFT_1227589 [Chytriomyces sp. MP71]|nr:hypothetical protein BC830DRAFT_1227589 [Chytriomyces sp. MP71]
MSSAYVAIQQQTYQMQPLWYASFISPAVLCAVAILSIGVLAWVIVKVELQSKKQTLSLTTVFTPANTLAFILAFTSVIYYAAMSVSMYSGATGQWSFTPVVITVSLGVLETAYLWFAWIRASDIIERQSSPLQNKIIKALLYASCLNPAYGLLTICLPNSLGFLVHIPGGAITCILDVYFGLSFAKYIFRLQENLTDVGYKKFAETEQYMIISRHGLFMSSCALSSLACFVVGIICLEANPTMETMISFNLFWMAKDFFLTTIGLCVLRMKMALINEKKVRKHGSSGKETTVVTNEA